MEDIKIFMKKIKMKKEAKQKLNNYKWDEEFDFLIDSSDEEYKEKQKLEKELKESYYPTFYKKHMKTIQKIGEMFYDTLEFSLEEIMEEIKELKVHNKILKEQNMDLKNKIKRLNTKNKK